MQTPWQQHALPPLALAATGAGFALLAVADKIFGLVQHPLYLATLAYLCLAGLLLWACVRGVQFRPARPIRPSRYAAAHLAIILTAAYVFAWRVSADPTPVVLQQELTRAREWLDAGEKDRAHMIYKTANQRFPNSFPVLMGLGAVSYQLTNFSRAETYYRRALEIAPSDSRWRVLNDLGQSLWKLGRPEEAVECYLQAKEAGMPRSEAIEWHYRLAWAYFDLGDYDGAIRHYLEVGHAGDRYAAASFYNAACAQTQKMKRASDPVEREELAEDAVENLRRSWRIADSTEEREELRAGVLGGPDERDPELEPLQGTTAFKALARDLQP